MEISQPRDDQEIIQRFMRPIPEGKVILERMRIDTTDASANNDVEDAPEELIEEAGFGKELNDYDSDASLEFD